MRLGHIPPAAALAADDLGHAAHQISRLDPGGLVLGHPGDQAHLVSGDRGQHWAAWNFGLLDLNVLALATSPAYAHDETIFGTRDYSDDRDSEIR